MPSKSSGRVKIFYPRRSRAALIKRIGERLETLEKVLPIRRVVLFGSWAKGKATAFSDVDLLVIYHDPPREDAYSTVWKILDVRGLQPHVYSETEAGKHGTTLARMTRGGLQIYPAELAEER